MIKDKLTSAMYSEKTDFETCTKFMVPLILQRTFNVSEYLVRTARELKKVKGILAKPAQKQGKVMYQNTIDLMLSIYEDDEFNRQMPGKKDYVSIVT